MQQTQYPFPSPPQPTLTKKKMQKKKNLTRFHCPVSPKLEPTWQSTEVKFFLLFNYTMRDVQEEGGGRRGSNEAPPTFQSDGQKLFLS